MKAIKHILFIASCILLASSCDEEISPDIRETTDTATFTFSPSVLGLETVPGTKSMGNTPDIHNIYFAVFDATGYKLSEYAQAVPSTLATTNDVPYQYSVELAITKEKRIVHIIANAPKRLAYGSESESIGALTTMIDASDPDGAWVDGDWQDSYWARLEFENGIWEAPDEGKHGVKGSPSYELQKTRYEEDMEILNSAKLVRNFAKIIVEQASNVQNFSLKGFWLTNYPDRGSVAPYNRTTGTFQPDYGDYSDVESIMTGADYRGYTPASARIISLEGRDDDDINDMMVSASGSPIKGETFCYEREIPRNNPLYVIVKGHFDGDPADTYYKLDIRNDSNEYFPILRNFSYSILINNVSSSGHATFKEALNGAPRNGDISTSMEMQELTNISNGKSQLFVSETSQILVGDAPVILRYKYIPYINISSLSGKVQNNTQQQANIEDEYGYVTIERSAGDTGDVFETMTVPVGDGKDQTDGYREITLKPNSPGSIIKNETITITGKAPKRSVANGSLVYDSEGNPIWESITRTVEYKLREKLSFSVECVPGSIPQGIGENLVVRIGLEEGLPSSMFSLNLDLEAAGLSLTPSSGEQLPVSTGNSTIGGNTKPAYHYTKLITWEMYQAVTAVDGVKYFDCSFKTNKSFSDGAGDQIYVSNKYFNQNSDSFTTFADKNFLSGSFSHANPHVGIEEQFTFTMDAVPANGKVRVGLQGFEPWPEAAGALEMRHLGLNSDGLDEYEVTVSSKTGTIRLNPYKTGQGIVKLYSNEFVPKRYETTIKMFISISSGEFKFDTSDRTEGQNAGVIPGYTTILSLPATSVKGISNEGKIVFTINGDDRQANLDGGYYKASYTVPSTQAAGQISVSVNAIDEYGDCTPVNLRNIPVWRQQINVGSKAITTVEGFADQQYNWEIRSGKRIWTGIVLRNASSTRRYLKKNGTSITNDRPDGNYSTDHCFQSDGSSYLKTYDGENLVSTKSGLGYFFSPYTYGFNLSESTSNLAKISKNGNYWQIQNSYDSSYKLYSSSNNATATGNANTDSYNWTAYPVTIEYVYP